MTIIEEDVVKLSDSSEGERINTLFFKKNKGDLFITDVIAQSFIFSEYPLITTSSSLITMRVSRNESLCSEGWQ